MLALPLPLPLQLHALPLPLLLEIPVSMTFPSQEVGTLPRGPVEQIDVWYAGARLAYGTLALKVWGAGVQQSGEWLCYISRCLEKGSHYTLACLKHAMARLDLSTSREVVFWSDNGRHFNCARTLSTQAVRLIEQAGVQVTVNFGMPKHFKNPCDGFFGVQAGAIDNITNEKLIKTIPQLVEALQQYYDEVAGNNSEKCEHLRLHARGAREHRAVERVLLRSKLIGAKALLPQLDLHPCRQTQKAIAWSWCRCQHLHSHRDASQLAFQPALHCCSHYTS